MPRATTHNTLKRNLASALISVVASTSVIAQESTTLDCSKTQSIDNVTYDFKSLNSEHTIQRNRDSPPTSMDDELRFNICQDLSQKEGVPETDQCPSGTRACFIKTNIKSGDRRVISVIPVAQSSNLDPKFTPSQSPAGLSILLHGSNYPTQSSSAQSLNLTLLCTQDGPSDPTLTSYRRGIVSVEWKTSAGCPVKSNDGDGGNDGDNEKDGSGEGEKGGGQSSSGSGIGWFFLLLFIAFIGYFALGAYYNYNSFGATGWDLVPHRDFWRDVPYLLRDFTEHLCSTLRPGRQSSRRGYMAV